MFFLFTPSINAFASDIKSNETENVLINNFEDKLDSKYIYNITSALSNIIFTEYDEKNGEIAKGREFGTKGELKASEILFENLTNLGLNTSLEKIMKRPGYFHDEDTYKLEVLDYNVKLNNKKIDCYVAPSWGGQKESRKELDTIFNFTGLKVKPLPKIPCLYNPEYALEKEDFVFIINDQWNDPNTSLPLTNILKPFLDPLKLYMIFHVRSLLNIKRYTAFWYVFYPNCKGLILYDFNKDCHDMIYFGGPYKNFLPVVFINGSDGRKILDDLSSSRLDLCLKQRLNTSVVSYNVVGQLNGTDTSKTFILSCLYDSWWCQGTADSAIGVGMVLAVAKYYVEHNIKPKYNMKFILFSGEEYDIRGAQCYEAVHKDERIEYIIDLNQIGFTQENPRLTLDIVGNKKSFLDEVWNVTERTNYVERTGNVTDIKKLLWASGNMPSNSYPFAVKRSYCKAISIFKDGGWVLHHRDGLNHSEGDVLRYFNWTDVNVTGELVLNITKHFTVDLEKQDDYSFKQLEKLELFAVDKI